MSPPLVQLRRWHAAMAPVVLPPLLLTVLSGMAYRLLKDWAGLGRDQVHWLMVLHEGEWLGSWAEPIYVLLNGLGLLWMLGSGGWMLLRRWRPLRSSEPPAP
ncbi:MAG: peptidase [Vulcanococcus sp.]